MIALEDRRMLALNITTATGSGASQRLACGVAGIDQRTLQRWNANEGLSKGDGRPQAVHPVPGHALSADERARLLSVANEPRFAAVPPARIVPMLADEGVNRPGQRIELYQSTARARTDHTQRALQSTQGCAATHHAHCKCGASGMELGYDLPYAKTA